MPAFVELSLNGGTEKAIVNLDHVCAIEAGQNYAILKCVHGQYKLDHDSYGQIIEAIQPYFVPKP